MFVFHNFTQLWASSIYFLLILLIYLSILSILFLVFPIDHNITWSEVFLFEIHLWLLKCFWNKINLNSHNIKNRMQSFFIFLVYFLSPLIFIFLNHLVFVRKLTVFLCYPDSLFIIVKLFRKFIVFWSFNSLQTFGQFIIARYSFIFLFSCSIFGFIIFISHIFISHNLSIFDLTFVLTIFLEHSFLLIVFRPYHEFCKF